MNIKWKKWAVLGLLLSVPLLSGGIFQGCSEPVQALFAPSNLSAIRMSYTKIKLTWSYNLLHEDSAYVEGFHVYRKCGDGQYELIADTSRFDQLFTDTDVPEGVQCTYYVTAYNSAGESGPSSEAGA